MSAENSDASGLSPESRFGLARGLAEFNERRFFDCHETLEDVWRNYAGLDRELIQGIIQIAVAYYHAGRANPVGAVKLLSRGLARVEKFACRGSTEGGIAESPIREAFELDLEKFVAKVSGDLEKLRAYDSSPGITLETPQIEPIS